MNTFNSSANGLANCPTVGPNGPPPQISSCVFRDNDLLKAFSRFQPLQPLDWNGCLRGLDTAAVRRRARRARRGREGRSCGPLGCSDDRAPPPPRPAPALASRRLPPPALLMLLLADMDVVNQVRVPAPRTEPAAGRPPRRGRCESADSKRWWPES